MLSPQLQLPVNIPKTRANKSGKKYIPDFKFQKNNKTISRTFVTVYSTVKILYVFFLINFFETIE